MAVKTNESIRDIQQREVWICDSVDSVVGTHTHTYAHTQEKAKTRKREEEKCGGVGGSEDVKMA